jgi:hypothetical protein
MAKANAAFILASRAAIERARQTGTPVIIGEGGRVVALTPDEAERRLNEKIQGESASQS